MSDESSPKRAELTALMEVSNAVLYRSFEETAKVVFETCKKLIDARSGYIALLSSDGKNNDVLFLDSGGLECTVDPALPMPIRGLRAEAYRSGKPVYLNDFHASEWIQYLPGGHVELRNVLFAPLMMNGKAVGLLGLANKPDGFNDEDVRTARAFGEFLAISLTLSRTTEALGESERKYRLLVENLKEGVWAVDEAGLTTYVNRQMAEMLGYTVDEMLGRPFFSFMDKNEAEKARMSLESRRKGVKEQLDFKLIRRDGSRVFTTMEAAPMTDDEGNYIGALAGVIDISERKAMEIELQRYATSLEEMVDEKTSRLVDAERLVAAGRLASMITHDLRGPLIVMNQAAGMIIRSPEKMERMLEMIRDNSQRALKMLEEVRAGTREIVLNIRETDLEALIKKVCEESQLPNSVLFEMDIGEGLSKVRLDPELIRRVLDNLIQNAIEAMSGGGKLIVRAFRSEKSINIDVADTGVGISDQEITHIFDLFHSTKFKGLGLGLPFCKRAVEAHGGAISFRTKAGDGTTFNFTIPITVT